MKTGHIFRSNGLFRNSYRQQRSEVSKWKNSASVCFLTLMIFSMGITNVFGQSNCVAAPSGLVSWWRAEGNANDFIGTNNGVLENGASFAAGKVGQAFSFNGANQSVQIADSPSLQLTNGFTIECWFNASNSIGNLVGKPVGSAYNDSYSIWFQSGNLQAKICNGSSQGNGLSYPFTPTPGVWYHVAFTVDNAQNQSLFLNGTSVRTGNTGISIGYDSHPFLIGLDTDFDSPVLPWQGEIDDVSIYNRALSATEIQSIYNAGSGGKCTQAAPMLTWPSPLSISYGASLGTNQLDATANVPGNFVYSPPMGTILNAGSNVLTVTFTPTDTVRYAITSDNVTIFVSQASLTVTANNASRTSIQTNPVFSGTITGLTNGDNVTVNYTCSAGPAGPPGVYPIVPVLVDPNGRLGNYSVTVVNGSLTVSAGPAPSLQVTSIIVPTEAWTGAAFDVSWTDTNSGTFAATGPWLDKIYLSPTSQFQITNSQLLGSFPFSANLAVGQVVKRTHPVIINRSGVTNGEFYVVVLADATGSVPGDSGANNPPGTSTNFNVFVTPLPDLIVNGVTSPANGIGGQPVTVSWTVCNTGQGDTDIPIWNDHVWLSPTTNISDAIVDYGVYANPDYLTLGECYQQSATVNLPVGYGGPFNFIVQANSTGALVEANSSNNIGFTASTINVQKVNPGFLHVVSSQVAPAPPTTTWPGQQITCTYVVQNTGQATITGTWDDQITLSSVSNFVNGLTTTFQYEVDIYHSGPFAPGATYTNSGQFTLPSSVRGSNVIGTWYVVPVVDIHFAAGGNGFGTGNIGRDELSSAISVIAPPQSDLITTSVIAPTNGVVGQAIGIQWTVSNQGIAQTSGNSWWDGIYFSSSPIFNLTNSTLLGTFAYFNGLALGASYTNSASVTIPTSAIGTNYFFVFADAGSNVAEITLTNNILGAPAPIVVVAYPPAQLVVPTVSIPNTAVAGRAFAVSWTVQNNGAGITSASNWTDSVCLSPSNQLGSSSILLGSVAHTGALNPGSSYGATQSFNIPVCDVGNYFVVVQADSGGLVSEAGAAALTVGSSVSTVRVLANPAASLQVYSVNAPASGVAGGNLTVNWTVLNSGNATTNAPWTDAIYISQSPLFNSSTATFLGVVPHYSNLTSGGSYAQSLTNVLPACLTGSNYIFVVTDAGNVVNTLSCQTNNVLRASAPTLITPAPYANLQVASIVLPAGASSGTPWTLQWSVINSGSGTAIPSWSDAVYASTQNSFDGSAILLGTFNSTNTLPSGSNYIQNQLVSVPTCVSGQYYIFVAADAGNQVDSTLCGSRSAARSTNSLTVTNPPYPDLQVFSVALPSTGSAGQSLPVSWTVTNSGYAAATGPWSDSIYLSPSASFNPFGSVFLGAYNYTNTLLPGTAYTQVENPIIPANVNGNYYLVVVTDSSNQVQECSGENNNTLVSTGTVQIPITVQPDLWVPAVFAPATAFSGQAVTLSWVITNDGNAATGGKVWYDTLYFSQDQILDPTDVRLGSFPRPNSLGVNGSYTNSATVLIPPSAAGPYYIFVVADSGGDLYDGYNEADTVGVTTNAMVVTLSSPVDLVATNVTISPSTGVPGSTANITWSVFNNSTIGSSATWTDGIYVSTNTVWDLTAVPLGTVNHNGLSGNGNYSGSWTGMLPALTPGNYHAIVRTDIRNTALETNLSNNASASANMISVDIPVITLGQTVTNQLSTSSQQYYKLNVAAGQTVLLSLLSGESNSANELYVRYGAVPDLGDYDFISTNVLAANQQIEIPTTQAGWYYIMMRGYNVAVNPETCTLAAQNIPLCITSVTPANIGDNGQVTITVNGALFQSGASVELVNGTNIYVAATNFFVNSTTVRARFFFTNAFHDIYSLHLQNPDSSSATLGESLTVSNAYTGQPQIISTQVNHFPRSGLPFVWYGFVTNSGNVDVQYLSVSSILDQELQLVQSSPQGAFNSSGINGTFFIRDLSPGSTSAFSFSVLNPGGETFNFDIEVNAYSQESFVSNAVYAAGLLRDGILEDTNITLVSQIAPLVQNQTNWDRAFVESLVSTGLLDSSATNEITIIQQTYPSTNYLIYAKSLVQSRDAYQDCRQAVLQRLQRHASNDKAVAVTAALSAALGCGYFAAAPPAAFACFTIAEATIGTTLLLALERDEDDATDELKACGNPPPSNCGQGGTVCPPSSTDPNMLIGPTGLSNSFFIGIQQPSLFTVYFANETNASAYARQVSITNKFDPNFDIRSFRLSEIAFGNMTIPLPANRTFYQTRVPAPFPNPSNIVVDVTAGIDLQNRLAFWTMNAIDLNTGQLVTDALQGVLPPDTTNQIGEGHVIYTILPNATDATGTVVTNEAVIVFDNNEPIPTNPTTNTVDGVPPTSTVASLPAGTLSTNFTLSWSGSDDVGGSGLLDFDIYVSDNGSPFYVWQGATTQTSATYSGQYGHTYSFYSIGHDNAGNTQAAPPSPQATIYVSSNTPPTLNPISNQTVNFTTHFAVTNIATDANGPGATLTYSLVDAPPGMTINPTNGILTWSPLPSQGGTTNLVTVMVTDNGVPPLSASQSFLAVVGDYTALTVPNTVVLAGQSGTEPIYFSSSASVTNMIFSFNYDTNRLTNWGITNFIAQVIAGNVSVISPSVAQVNLSFGGGQLFHGTQAVAQLTFNTFSNRHSAFLPLDVSNLHVFNSATQLVTNDLIQNGRITFVGIEPMLELLPSGSNINPTLVLYGKPGSSYLTEWRTNLVATGGWNQGFRIPMSNVTENFSINGSLPMAFYRAEEFFADPPLLEISGVGSSNLSLLIYGKVGTNYVLQSNTNIADANSWLSQSSFSMTNSYLFIGAGGTTNPAIFFRAKRP